MGFRKAERLRGGGLHLSLDYLKVFFKLSLQVNYCSATKHPDLCKSSEQP